MDTYPGHELVEGGDGAWVGRAESKFGKCAYHTLPKYGLIVERVFR